MSEISVSGGVSRRSTRQERIAYGRSMRKRFSRSKLGEVNARKREFDPIALLLEATRGRVPALLPLKYKRMSASPFAFFRGAVSIMAADLARADHTGLFVQLCGDAHLQNLGCFETPDGRLVFDINDFDETIDGPWEWDVKRLAASIVLAGLESQHSKSACGAAVSTFVSRYVDTMDALANMPVLDAARHQIHRLRKAQPISAALKQAQRSTPQDLVQKYTETDGRGGMRFKKIDSVLWRLQGKQRTKVLDSLALYRESLPPERLHLFGFFRAHDVAFKVVGTGSVGLRDYVVLMQGNGGKDPLFLQIKQEVASAYAPYLKHPAVAHQGVRVALGQRRLQPVSDLFLGWTRIEDQDFLVRQLNDHKGSIDLNQLRGPGLTMLAGIAGELLARGHARSGDPLAIATYIGPASKVQSALVNYGLEYAGVTQADFEAFTNAIKRDRIKIAA
ncbi:MAG: DUF2252 domain-containing protein [Acidobacteriaceae bacterium]|nr:DUF2252 domain-containing protein [Acidobacteriaceae bacterium]